MADGTYQVGVYRSSGGSQLEVVSSGRIVIDSGGKISVLSNGVVDIAGTALITTGGKVDLSSTPNFINGNIYTTGTIKGDGGVTSTGTGTFNAISSTGAGTFDSITTTGGAAGTIKGQRITANTGYVQFVEQATSSYASLTAYGVSYLNASTAVTMPLAAPIAGVEKWIAVQTTAASVTITSSSFGADIAGSTQAAISTGTAVAPSWLHLIGKNSTSWQVLGVSANVSIT